MELNMFKRTVCSALLVAGASCLPVHAQSLLWNFQYTGFRLSSEIDEGFFPDEKLSGLFVGADNNANGVLEFSEVTRFDFDKVRYAKNSSRHLGCPYDSCELTSFSYNLGTNKLQFSAEYNRVDPVIGGEFGNVIAGNYYLKFVYADIGHPRTWTWTDQTQFTISAIPEPSSLTMSAAGLLLLLGRLRLHRRLARRG
jgi:hypothetical protein